MFAAIKKTLCCWEFLVALLACLFTHYYLSTRYGKPHWTLLTVPDVATRATQLLPVQ